MKVLITTYAERTHFLLLVPLAWALRTAGHEVRVAVQPKLVDTVTQAGLTAVPVGHDRDLWDLIPRTGAMNFFGKETGWPAPYDSAEQDAAEVTWEQLRTGYRDVAVRWHKTSNVPIVADLVDFARSWEPDLVIWEPTTYAGAIAATACGAAHARILIGADVFGITRDHATRLIREHAIPEREDPLAHWLGSYARKYGGEFTEAMVTGHFTIDQLPPSLAFHGGHHYLHARYTPYGGPAVVPGWLSTPPPRPRVALTMGLTANDRTGEYPVNLQDVLDAVADLDVELVATVTDAGREALDRIPDNARLVPFVPLQALMPTCSAAIHHAGVGTLATTALAAVPQLTLPWDVDQPMIGRRLAEQGAGLCIPATEVTVPALREAVLRLLSEPSFARAAGALREEMLAQPAPNQLVAQIEQLTTKHRSNG
ncbi:activator-dependent family glycosyltransferase [Amycolatopsis suaedae]|uniref:Activator-dependent family glycosyltransferase n=1 Tax=Amycolatopsis suaedae TaxID=2510978 RepID=A0A4Q7J3G6_9PSEU|nr:activator-dependent family glycosyltransferase [Amycolatopsis suaedae]RZQ61162.1 activator-dependent family glycosyltransferase [Amycolatopsis suaedae]